MGKLKDAACVLEREAYNRVVFTWKDGMPQDLNSVGDEQLSNWLREVGGDMGHDNPSDENLAALVSGALRESSSRARASALIDAANMCLALADKTLGCQVPVAKCLVENIH